MLEFNYFQVLAVFWATVAIVSRIFMLMMGPKWKKWEMSGFYKQKKPVYIYIIAGLGFVVLVGTWIQVFVSDVRFGWILAVLLSLTLIKILSLLFNYDAFRSFAVKMLSDQRKMIQLNVAVLTMAIGLILMAVYVY